VKFDKLAYKRRSIIENVIGWLKECRRVGTRYEKLAVSFQAMLQLAMIRNCLKIAFFRQSLGHISPEAFEANPELTLTPALVFRGQDQVLHDAFSPSNEAEHL